MSVMATLWIVGNRKSLIPVAEKDFCLQKCADRLWVSAGLPCVAVTGALSSRVK